MAEKNHSEKERRVFGDPVIRKGVVAGVIASVVFAVLVWPAIQLLGSVLLNTSSRILKGYVDERFRLAAGGSTNLASVLVFYLCCMSLSAFGFVTLIVLRNSIRRIEGKPSRFVLPPKVLAFMMNILPAVFVVFALLSLMLVEQLTANEALNSWFRQTVTTLSPHLTGQEEEELRAQWASMASREDFVGLRARMETIAASKAVRLPRPAYFALRQR